MTSMLEILPKTCKKLPGPAGGSIKDIAFVIHDGVQALDLAGPLDVLTEANGFSPNAYRCVVVAGTTAPLTASNGMTLTAHLSFEEATRPFHTVLVAGGPSLPDRPEDKAMSCWLRSWAVKAERYGSICTGTFVLGHAGLLDGRTATTHWQNAARLAALFPAARIEPDRIFHRDGALVTSAGVARLFVDELGITPHDFVEGVRVDHARNLLEATDLALKAIAFDCGFGSYEQMRGVFYRRLGVSPRRYRGSFQPAPTVDTLR